MEYKEVRKLFSDIWRFYERYQRLEFTDQLWQNFIKDHTVIFEQYGYSRLSFDLLMAVISEIKRETEYCSGKLYSVDSYLKKIGVME